MLFVYRRNLKGNLKVGQGGERSHLTYPAGSLRSLTVKTCYFFMRRNRNDPVQKKRGRFYKNRVGYTPDRLELIWLKTLPMIGPRTIRAAITTMATKTRIRAYSTSPWPFSLGVNNMWANLLSLLFPGKTSTGCSYFTSSCKKSK